LLGLDADEERIKPMDIVERFTTWCTNERVKLRQQLEQMESGAITTGEKLLGSPPRDTTAQTIADVRRKIAELDSLLG
jgi:hypothetical protein